MSKEEFVKAMSYLGIAYNKKFNNEELTIWYSFFNDIDKDILKVAIKNIIEKNQYLPTIADLKREVNKIKNPELKLFAEDEWLAVLNVIRQYGYYQVEKAMNSLKPYTRKIVERIGYLNLCLSENINWERKVFIETFNACKKNQEYMLIENDNEKILVEKKKNIQNKKIDEILQLSSETRQIEEKN